MTLKNSVRHVWRSFAIRLFTGIYKCSKCLHFEKKYVVFFLFFYFGQILLQNVLCTTLLVENSTHQVILIPKSDLVCSLKYCNALLLQNQFFFSFFFIFTYVSDQIWINQSDHQNVHKIPDLFMYNMSKVVNFAERFDLILMWLA